MSFRERHYRRPSSFDPPRYPRLIRALTKREPFSRVRRVPSDANRPVAQGPSPCKSDACSLPRDYLSLSSSRSLVPRGLREYRVIDLRSTLVCPSGDAADSPRKKGKITARSTTSDCPKLGGGDIIRKSTMLVLSKFRRTFLYRYNFNM